MRPSLRAWSLSLGIGLLLAACSPSSPAATELFVDPDVGNDANAGSLERPLKTIKKALENTSIKTIVLLAGTYDEVSGETWNYTLPAGQTLRANSSSTLLQSKNNAKAFSFAGDATLKDLNFKGFSTVLSSETGTQTLQGLSFEGNAAAIQLSKNAQMVVSSSNFLNNNGSNCCGSVVDLQDSAKLSMTGGKFEGGLSAEPFRLSGIASIELNKVSFNKTNGYGQVFLTKSSKATLTDCSINQVGNFGVYVSDSAEVVLKNTSIYYAAYAGVYLASSSAQAQISGGYLSYNKVYGLYMSGGSAQVTGTTIASNGSDGVYASAGSLSLTQASFSGHTRDAIEMGSSSGSIALQMRTTVVDNTNRKGIVINSTFGSLNLGDATTAGGNTLLSQTGYSGLEVSLTSGTIQAVGNTWKPSIQGADAAGKYGSQLIDGPKSGDNFYLPTGVKLQL